MALAARETWAQRVDAWQSSGLTAQQYAAREGLNANTLRGWKSRLKRAGVSAGRSDEGSAAKDVVAEEPLGLWFLQRRLPARGRQVKDASLRPGRQQAKQVAQVAPRLDSTLVSVR